MIFDASKTAIQIRDCYEQVDAYFSPKVVGRINDVLVKIAKIKGEDIPWHSHEMEDELFYIVKGELFFESRKHGSFTMNEGKLFIVEKGIEHRVSAKEECWIMLIEKDSTKHTGEVDSKITRSLDEQMR